MIGSPQVGWWIAHIAFWALIGLAALDSRWRTIAVFLMMWLAGYIASGQIAALGLFFMPTSPSSTSRSSSSSCGGIFD